MPTEKKKEYRGNRPQPVTKKEMNEAKESSRSNLDIILDLVSRPSGAVAGALSEPVWRTDQQIKKAWQNLTGERKDSWSQNISNMTGIPEDSWTARIGGFVGDTVADPLNLVGMGLAGKAAKVAPKFMKPALQAIDNAPKAVRKTAQTLQTNAKAGQYGKAAETVAQTAKKAKGLLSNYAGLTPEEKAVAQLFDAKKHSLDDLVKEHALDIFGDTERLIKKNPADELKLITSGTETAVDEGKALYKQLLEKAQLELSDEVAQKFGQNLNPDFQQAVMERLGKAKKAPKPFEGLERLAAKWGASNNPVSKVDRGFKLGATRANPSFYINNMMGNVQQTMQEASTGKPFSGIKDTLSQYAREYGNMGTGIKNPVTGAAYDRDYLQALGRERGVRTNVSSIYKGKEVGGSLDDTLREMAEKYLIQRHEGAPMKWMPGRKTETGKAIRQGVGKAKAATTSFLDSAQGAVEGRSRQAAFNTYFKQGLSEGLDEAAAANKAAVRVAQSLFDYEDVTPLVRGLRSMPVVGQPFITWAAKNAPRQVAMLGKNPAFANKVSAGMNIFEGPKPSNEENYVPDYARDRGSFAVGGYDDKKVFFNPALTMSDVNNVPASLADKSLNPMTLLEGMAPTGKAIGELISNKDSFTGRDIAAEGENRLTAPQSVSPEMRWLMNQAPGLFGDMGATRAKSSGNPMAPYWMKEAFEFVPVARKAVRIAHNLAEPDKASDKTPFGLGEILPVDVRTNKQLKVSQQFEDKKLATIAKGKRKEKRNEKMRMRSLEKD
jgi:hypothetical protein